MSDVEMETLEAEIKETQERLSSLRKEYKEKKYASLKMAMEAKREADRALAEEYKALGISSATFAQSSFFLDEISILAPAKDNCNAIALPIPLDEPVIITTLFFKLNILFFLNI